MRYESLKHNDLVDKMVEMMMDPNNKSMNINVNAVNREVTKRENVVKLEQFCDHRVHGAISFNAVSLINYQFSSHKFKAQ